MGLWQGFVMPFTFIFSLFDSNISIYEVHNNGGWYNFGYWLGTIITLGGSSSASRKRS